MRLILRRGSVGLLFAVLAALSFGTFRAVGDEPTTAPVGETVIATGCHFPEGPSLSRDRKTLYTVNVQSSAISRLELNTGKFEYAWVTLPDGGKGNGSGLGPDGDLYVCDVACKRIDRISTKTGDVTVVVDKDSDGKPFLGPNDIAFARDGSFYFTDPNGTWKNPIGAIYHYTPATKTIERVLAGLLFPNGCALTPDEKSLYYGESPKGSISIVDLANRSNIRVFLLISPDADPDGIRVDSKGFVFAACFGKAEIVKISPDGQIVKRYPLTAGKNVTNFRLDEKAGVMYVTETQSNTLLKVTL